MEEGRLLCSHYCFASTKNFGRAGEILVFRGVGGGWEGVWVNPLKKKNLGQKSALKIMLYEALKISEKWYQLM